MFKYIDEFEEVIANFFGAKYGVATDCCTHAVELCLRLNGVTHTTCPKHTYLSIPMTFERLNINWQWNDILWQDHYTLENTNIIDAAVFWKEGGYIPGTMMCLSFQFKKHLSLGRGGMILLDDKAAYSELIKLSYDGRTRDLPWAQQDITSMGYHYYMTPETAIKGLEKFPMVKYKSAVQWSYNDYPDLSKLPVFSHVK